MRYLIALGMFACMNVWGETKWEILKDQVTKYGVLIGEYHQLKPEYQNKSTEERLRKIGVRLSHRVEHCKVRYNPKQRMEKSRTSLVKELSRLREKLRKAEDAFAVASKQYEALSTLYHTSDKNEKDKVCTDLDHIHVLLPYMELTILSKEFIIQERLLGIF